MKVALIIYVVYESVMIKVSHSALDVEMFTSVPQCEFVKEKTVEIINKNTRGIDSLEAECVTLPDAPSKD